MVAVELPGDISFFKNIMDCRVIQEPDMASSGILFLRSI